MVKLVNRVLVVFAAVVGVVASAQDLRWQTVRIRGEGRAAVCNEATVTAFYAGSFASFIFSALGVDLPAQGEVGRMTEFGACQVRSRLVIPRGFTLTALSQTVTGGALKSRGAQGSLRSLIFMRTPPNAAGRDAPLFTPTDGQIDPEGLGLLSVAEQVFRPRDDNAGELLALNQQLQFGPGRRRMMCQWSRGRDVAVDVIWRTAVRGARTRPDQGILIQVDGVDTMFELGVGLEACP